MTPTRPEIYGELTEILRDVLLIPDLELYPEMTAKDVPGWDSLKQIAILLSIEQRWGIRLHVKDFEGIANVGGLVELVASRIAK
ncbi:MAG: acyl carrier protein [Alphaproteobacteria bacterium]|nr:acyl carrier protein [Alphaproteobacteria bacterium]